MIDNYNESKNPSTVDFVDVRKFIGVGAINVVAINPTNAVMRNYGWAIPEDAAERKYVYEKTNDAGKPIKSTRICFLVQLCDFETKPIVAMDFWIGNDLAVSKENKLQVIDSYCRTAWVTKDEWKAHAVPQYSNGPADISKDYKACHRGEEALLRFIFKYLNITPLQIFDSKKNQWVPSKTPGRLTIDDWDALCAGNTKEIEQYIALMPNNRVKVVFGTKTNEENKTYQTFLNSVYIGNGAKPDRNTGEYTTARKAIDRYLENHPNATENFLATPIKMWQESVTEVKDNSSEELPDGNAEAFNDDPDNDLPF